MKRINFFASYRFGVQLILKNVKPCHNFNYNLAPLIIATSSLQKLIYNNSALCRKGRIEV